MSTLPSFSSTPVPPLSPLSRVPPLAPKIFYKFPGVVKFHSAPEVPGLVQRAVHQTLPWHGGIAIGSDGRIVVAGTVNHRVQALA